MEPRLNVKISNLFMEPFDGPNPVDVDFIPQGVQMDNDFMDTDSNDSARNQAVETSWRSDWANEIDRDNAVVENTDARNLYNNPGAQVGPYQTAAKQAKGFGSKQAHKNATLGVIADLQADTLVGSRVYAKTASSNVRGTVIAIGDKEFAVVWDDRTASVERKNDYELVVKN